MVDREFSDPGLGLDVDPMPPMSKDSFNERSIDEHGKPKISFNVCVLKGRAK